MYTYIIIDDEPLIRRGTIKKLENYPGISCAGQASNGQAGLELIQETDPDFIITDMKMPVLDGSRLLPILSERYPDKYIIVISGYKDFEYAQQALRANTVDYLHEAFLETADALNQLTLLPADNYIFYNPEQEKHFTPEWSRLETFLFMVESGHTDEVVNLFPDLFHYFARTERCRLKDAKEYCLKISEILKQSFPKDIPVHKGAEASLNLLNNLNFVFSFSKLEDYFLQLFRNMSEVFESAGFYTEKNVIENIKIYIEHHYEKDLTLEFVASLFHLNRSYLSSTFKARTGIRFVDYVNQIRIKHAKDLLKNTDKKNYQIAQSVGYENVKYFFRIFKKTEGITPEQFRAKNNF